MGYYVSFAVEDEDEPVDGDEVASNAGWAGFGDWATGLGPDYPELAYLAWHGECHPAEAVEALLEELPRAIRDKPEKPTANNLHVAQRLLEAVTEKPPRCVGFVVTDGTEGGEEDD